MVAKMRLAVRLKNIASRFFFYVIYNIIIIISQNINCKATFQVPKRRVDSILSLKIDLPNQLLAPTYFSLYFAILLPLATPATY